MHDLTITELERLQKDFDNHSSDVETGFASWGGDCDKQDWMMFKEKLDLEISLCKENTTCANFAQTDDNGK